MVAAARGRHVGTIHGLDAQAIAGFAAAARPAAQAVADAHARLLGKLAAPRRRLLGRPGRLARAADMRELLAILNAILPWQPA